jgi:hypothetical protein
MGGTPDYVKAVDYVTVVLILVIMAVLSVYKVVMIYRHRNDPAKGRRHLDDTQALPGSTESVYCRQAYYLEERVRNPRPNAARAATSSRSRDGFVAAMEASLARRLLRSRAGRAAFLDSELGIENLLS